MVRHHCLPGEGDETAWFFRLNEFEQQETLRQVDFKRRHWPEMPDGSWSKRPSYTYPHILPGGELSKAFFPPIADAVPEYCRENCIAIHSESLNLRSSQVSCFNVMFPLGHELDLARMTLQSLLPGVEKVSRIEFDLHTGPDGTTEWLGEPTGGKRGQNRTSIDTAIWWESLGRTRLTLVEWKYTERSFGTCGGYDSKGNQTKRVCRELDIAASDPAKACYLTTRKGRRYWEHLTEAGINLDSLAETRGCPFRGPFYQLMRQYLLAAFARQQHEADDVMVALVGFRGNEGILRTPRHLWPLGRTMVDAWNAVVPDALRISHTDVQKIASALKRNATPEARELSRYLSSRYGL